MAKTGRNFFGTSGVLFLDEMPEFGQRVLEVIRQPLEDKQVTISRAQGSLTFPASFQLITAMNPCQCGYFGDDLKECTCAHSSVSRYQKRISGPLLDRLDIHLQVPRVNYKKLGDDRIGENSLSIQKRVVKARNIQLKRFKDSGGIYNSADMSVKDIGKYCQLDLETTSLLDVAMKQMKLSARAYHRILKLSRTIADLAYSKNIKSAHLAEALQYRPNQMMM